MLIYSIIAICGLLVLGGIAVFGGDADADVEVDLDADGGHHWLSVKVWAVFAMGFGAAGAIAEAYGAPNWLALVLGIVTGVLLGALAAKLVDLLHRQQASSTYQMQDLLGKTATVTLPILEGKMGEVCARIGGTQVTRSARSHDGKAIAQGAAVEVVHIGPPLTVRPVDAAAGAGKE